MDGRELTGETRMEIGTARRKKWKKGKREERKKKKEVEKEKDGVKQRGKVDG
jgi:hypothetical protein